MRETQILRGLHKARAKLAAQQVRHYAGGTPYVGNALETMGGNDMGTALAAAGARGDAQALQGAYQQNGGTWQGTTAAQDAAAVPTTGGAARGLRPAPFIAPFTIQKFAEGTPSAQPVKPSLVGFAKYLLNGKKLPGESEAPAQPKAPATNAAVEAAKSTGIGQAIKARQDAIQALAHGSPFVDGQAGIDKVPAMLTKGEAVLPVKTVQKVGAHNIARLIAQTNGETPAKGLRAGGKYRIGEVPWNQTTGAAPGVMVGGKAPLPEVELNPQGMKASNAANGWNSARPTVAGTTTAAPSMAPDIDFNATKPAAPAASPQTGVRGAVNTATNAVKSGANAVGNTVGGWRNSVRGALSGGSNLLQGLGAGVGGGLAVDALGDIGKSQHDAQGTMSGTAGTHALQIPTGGAGVNPIAPSKQPYNFFNDTDAGRNIKTTLPALSMLPVGGLLSTGMRAGMGGAQAVARAEPLVNAAVGGAAGKTLYNSDAEREARAAEDAARVPQAPAFTAYSNPDANQTAATRERTGLRLADKAGDGRGVMQSTTDFTSQLANVPSELPKGLREGVVYKTKGAHGETVYSGSNISPDSNGKTAFVDGTGKSITPRGSLEVADHNSPIGMGAGGYAYTASPRGLGAAQGQSQPDTNTEKGYYQNSAPQPQSTQGGLGPAQQALQAALNGQGGMMTKARLAGLTQAAATEVQAQGNRMHADVGHESNDVTREGNILQAQSRARQIQFEMSRYGNQMGIEGAKTLDEMNKNSSYATIPGKEPGAPSQLDTKRAGDLTKYISQTNAMVPTGDGRSVPFSQALSNASLIPAAREVHARLQGELGMKDELGKYFNDSMFGANSAKSGRLKILGVKPIEASDWSEHGTHALDVLKSKGPGAWGNGVVVQASNGRKIVMPMHLLNNSPNSAEYLDAINGQLAERGQQGIDMYGNPVK